MSKQMRLHLYRSAFDQQVLKSSGAQQACVNAAQHGTHGDRRYQIVPDSKAKHRRGCAVFAYNPTLLNRAIGGMHL
jgi:hypothetical protein